MRVFPYCLFLRAKVQRKIDSTKCLADFLVIFSACKYFKERRKPHIPPEGDLPCGGGGGEFISIYDFEVQEIGFKSNDCMKESKSVKTSPSSLMLSSIAAIVSSLA